MKCCDKTNNSRNLSRGIHVNLFENYFVDDITILHSEEPLSNGVLSFYINKRTFKSHMFDSFLSCWSFVSKKL